MWEVALTPGEIEVLRRLPGPPTSASIQTTNVWIIEWLGANDRKTGSELHAWLQEQRPGWSALYQCRSKAEVLDEIEHAAALARQSSFAPVLHLECHGDDVGLEGPCGPDGLERLNWEELAQPLQRLNLATKCNLTVFIAACTGFAGVKAFRGGPRAPAVALVGPIDVLPASDLLNGAKEFYRRFRDDDVQLQEVAASASRESGQVEFEVEPFALLAFEAIVEGLLVSLRPEEKRQRMERVRQLMRERTNFSDIEIESRWQNMPILPDSDVLQQIWDTLFMIDLWPGNRERFGVDMAMVRKLIIASDGRATF